MMKEKNQVAFYVVYTSLCVCMSMLNNMRFIHNCLCNNNSKTYIRMLSSKFKLMVISGTKKDA